MGYTPNSPLHLGHHLRTRDHNHHPFGIWHNCGAGVSRQTVVSEKLFRKFMDEGKAVECFHCGVSFKSDYRSKGKEK